MARNQFEDIIKSVISGGLAGAQAGRASSQKLEETLMLEKLKQGMKHRQLQDILSQSGDARLKSVSGAGEPTYEFPTYDEQVKEIKAKELLGISDEPTAQPTMQSTPSSFFKQPTPPTGSSLFQAPKPKIGGIAGRELAIKSAEQQQTAEIKGMAKAQEASTKALGNLGKIASAIKLYSKYYEGSLREGGTGSLVRKTKAKILLGIGGQGAEHLKNTSKLYGQGIETALQSGPIMTGQSRYVDSLREALQATYPQGNVGPGIAASMLDQTLTNMYMTFKVMSRLGIDIDDPKAGDNLTEEDANKVLVEAGYNPMAKKWDPANINKLSPEERRELDLIRKDAVGNLYDMETNWDWKVNKGTTPILTPYSPETEAKISRYMAQDNMPRERVIKAMKKKGLLNGR